MKPCQTQATVRLSALILVLNSVAICPQNMGQNSSAKPNRDINVVLAAHDQELLAIPDVIGVYVGTMQDGQTLCFRVMLARKNPESEQKIPRTIEGYPVVTEVTGNVRALERP
jgi:hypothetical protein